MASLTPYHVSILNTLDHGGEMHAFEIGHAQSVGKQLAFLRRRGLVRKRVISEGVSALWSITDIGRSYLCGLAAASGADRETDNG